MQQAKIIATGIALTAILLSWQPIIAQDFLLEDCFWRCRPADSAAAQIKLIQQEARGWAHAGFTGVWLPDMPTGQIQPLANALRTSGMEPLAYLPAPPASAGPEKLLAEAKILRDRYRIRNMHIGQGLEAWHYAALLNVAITEKAVPDIVVADPGRQRNAQGIAAWINAVYDQIPDTDAPLVSPRALDHPLREALRRACTSPAYDVRSLFSAGLRDATSLTGFHALTYVNASFLPEDELNPDPLLAYAYILTNNQLGLPMVHLGDYRNPDAKDAIDQLIEAHRQYIFNSPEAEYLNRHSTERRSLYLSGAQGANERRVLLFQIDGRNTPAGKAAGLSRDVLVAINFSEAPLKLIHELNPSNLRPGDRLFDVLGLSDTPELTYSGENIQGIPNAVYMELPPRSYALWVQGEASVVLPGEIRLSARQEAGFVELNWEAPSEPGIRYFDVERSSNGGVFERISRVEALPVSSEAAYLHLDENATRGKQYAYRIKAVKKEGHFFSPVVKVALPAERIRFEILPGTSTGERLLRVRSNVEGQARVQLIDKAGKVVHSETFPLVTGETKRPLPVHKLPPGLYLIEVQINGERVWVERLLSLGSR